MVDLGIYNYVKNALARGESKEAIVAVLQKQNLDETVIAEIFSSVEQGVLDKPETLPQNQTYSATSLSIAWYNFRNEFWVYFLIVWIINIFSRIIPLGPLGPIVSLVGLVCLIRIAMKVAYVTKIMGIKFRFFYIFFGFILPPAAFYLVYREAKKYGWQFKLSFVEKIFVSLGMITYLLWLIRISLLILSIILANV